MTMKRSVIVLIYFAGNNKSAGNNKFASSNKKGGPWERILRLFLTLLFAVKAPERALLFKAYFLFT